MRRSLWTPFLCLAVGLSLTVQPLFADFTDWHAFTFGRWRSLEILSNASAGFTRIGSPTTGILFPNHLAQRLRLRIEFWRMAAVWLLEISIGMAVRICFLQSRKELPIV